MKANLTGVGLWGPGFKNLAEFQALLNACGPADATDVMPKPERIPPRERRRAPLMVKLAVEVADQACRMANVDPASAQSVFTSGIGDADITDYMCRILAGPDKLLSPTKFHNSVHNAAAGYWSISTNCTKPATFISSMRNSFSLALIETLVQVSADDVPVLLVVSDLAMPEPMRTLHPIEQMLGVALLFEPDSTPVSTGIKRPFSLSLQTAQSSTDQWPALDLASLDSLYHASPAARSLCFVEAICQKQQWHANLPVSETLVADVLLEPSDTYMPVSASLEA